MRLRLLSRSPLTYWVAVGGLALVTTLAISGLLGRARTEAARYGSPRSVLVATRDVPLGAQLRAGDVEVQSLPSALVPPDAVGGVGQAQGRVVVVPVFEGQAVVRRQLAPWGVTGAAALLPPGKRGISVAAGTPLKTHLCASAREVCASKPLSTFASPIRQRGVLPAAVSALAISTPSGKHVLT